MSSQNPNLRKEQQLRCSAQKCRLVNEQEASQSPPCPNDHLENPLLGHARIARVQTFGLQKALDAHAHSRLAPATLLDSMSTKYGPFLKTFGLAVICCVR